MACSTDGQPTTDHSRRLTPTSRAVPQYPPPSFLPNESFHNFQVPTTTTFRITLKSCQLAHWLSGRPPGPWCLPGKMRVDLQGPLGPF